MSKFTAVMNFCNNVQSIMKYFKKDKLLAAILGDVRLLSVEEVFEMLLILIITDATREIPFTSCDVS